jgi:GNAT superfamily N-acetyltransferase
VTRHFGVDYSERATLRDGSEVSLRLLRPEDKLRLRAGFEQLSAESRYARFLSPKTTLSDEELRYLCEIDQESHFALGAERDGEGLGIARFIRLSDEPTVAEAAITVADHAQGRGLGKLLFLRLCAAANERGIHRFRCEVLGTNHGMAALLATIAPERTIVVESGVMTIDLAVPAVSSDEPVTTAPAGGMYKLFRAAAENTVEWTEAVRALWRR